VRIKIVNVFGGSVEWKRLSRRFNLNQNQLFQDEKRNSGKHVDQSFNKENVKENKK